MKILDVHDQRVAELCAFLELLYPYFPWQSLDMALHNQW